jgi:hypothetical protein
MQDILLKNINTLKDNSKISDKEFKCFMNLSNAEFEDFLTGDFDYNQSDIIKLSDLFLISYHDLAYKKLNNNVEYVFNKNINKQQLSDFYQFDYNENWNKKAREYDKETTKLRIVINDFLKNSPYFYDTLIRNKNEVIALHSKGLDELIIGFKELEDSYFISYVYSMRNK